MACDLLNRYFARNLNRMPVGRDVPPHVLTSYKINALSRYPQYIRVPPAISVSRCVIQNCYAPDGSWRSCRASPDHRVVYGRYVLPSDSFGAGLIVRYNSTLDVISKMPFR